MADSGRSRSRGHQEMAYGKYLEWHLKCLDGGGNATTSSEWEALA